MKHEREGCSIIANSTATAVNSNYLNKSKEARFKIEATLLIPTISSVVTDEIDLTAFLKRKKRKKNHETKI